MGADRDLNVGMKCVKYMLFVANFMFVLVGFLMISIGSTIKAIYTDFEQFMESQYYSPSTLAICIGVIIFFVALFGCVGAVKESTCLVNTYAFFLTCILILELSVCIAAYAMRSNLMETVRFNMEKAMDNYDNEYNAFTWNATQYNLRCCGVDGPTDWSAYADRYNLTQATINVNTTESIIYVPDTCCYGEDCSQNIVYAQGCLRRLTYIVSECALLLAVGALCVSFIQLLGIIFARMLAKSIRKLKTQILVERQERRQQLYEQLAKVGSTEKVTPVLYTPTSSEA